MEAKFGLPNNQLNQTNFNHSKIKWNLNFDGKWKKWKKWKKMEKMEKMENLEKMEKMEKMENVRKFRKI